VVAWRIDNRVRSSRLESELSPFFPTAPRCAHAMAVYRIKDQVPDIHPAAFVAESAT